MLTQTVAILPIVAAPDATREEVITAAQDSIESEPFGKEGFVVVGQLGLKFNEHGRLIEIGP